MTMRRCNAERIAQCSVSRATLEATGRHHWAPADAMVINFWPKKSSCGIVKSLSEASIQKALSGPSTQLIKATSCVERTNARIKAEELS